MVIRPHILSVQLLDPLLWLIKKPFNLVVDPLEEVFLGALV
jgi:hypothetical protein